jgi:hypothetical protein
MLQSKLNQYPIETIDTNISRSQQSKRSYNANRYSPKTTPRRPITSTVIRPKSTKNSNTRNEKNQAKRHTIAADNVHTFHLSVPKIKHDDDELQLKSAPINEVSSTQNVRNSVELKKITTSIQTMRTSVLQA